MTEFMQKQIVSMTCWIVDTNIGTEVIPKDWTDKDSLLDYTEGSTINWIAEENGFYARLSAPGYMDCTDWSGPYDTEQEAMTELDSLYYSD